MSFNLSTKIKFRVRFNEADPLGIVWHGNYLKYFEDGRESFGEQYNLGYLDIHGKGYVVPIVNINCNFKKSLKFGESGIIETTFINSAAAKIIFEYKIYKHDSLELIAEGTTTQVFLDSKTNELQLCVPDFFEEWKIKSGIANK